MPRLWVLLLLLSSTPALAKPPRLTLIISVDSMGTDVLWRMRPRLKGGLSQLLNQGAVFPDARYEYAETVTAVGHTTLSTGANPWRHGIVSNRVINRTTGKSEAMFTDASHPVLEAPLTEGDDASPEALMAETLSDRLRLATQGRGKSVALSAKARAAISLAGRLGQAWWFSEPVGKFVTGTYYTKEAPAWLKAFNDKRMPEALFGKEWALSAPASQYIGEDDRPFESDLYGMGRTFPHRMTGGLDSPGPRFYSSLVASRFMTDILVQAARAAIDGEQLGKDDIPDLLQISVSSPDRIYHLYGPYSWEMQDVFLAMDRALTDLIAAAERAAGGRSNLLVVLAADHGGAAIPEEWSAAGFPAVRVDVDSLMKGLNKELSSKFGADLVLGTEEIDVYLNNKVLTDKRLDGAAVRRAAAQWLGRHPSIAVAVAKDDLTGDPLAAAGYLRSLRLGYFPDRSGDVLFLPRPFHVLSTETHGTNHGTPYSYDTQVPVIFAGKGIKSGVFMQRISPVDVAPTVATLLEIGIPAMAEGSPRPEVTSTSR